MRQFGELKNRRHVKSLASARLSVHACIYTAGFLGVYSRRLHRLTQWHRDEHESGGHMSGMLRKIVVVYRWHLLVPYKLQLHLVVLVSAFVTNSAVWPVTCFPTVPHVPSHL